MGRDRGAELHLCKGWWVHVFPLLGARETLHRHKKAPWGVKRGGHHPIICNAKPPPAGLWARIHLGKKLHTHVGKGPQACQVWEKKSGNWPEANEDLEELPYADDLTTSLPLSSQDGTPTPFLCLTDGPDACMLSRARLWDPLDCGPPGSSVHGISQARILEWISISFSRGSSRPRDWSSVSCISCIAGYSLPLSHRGSPLSPSFCLN